jgi:transglutaminase-like putative cysteine protease
MKYILIFLPFLAFSQISPIKDALLVNPYYGVLAESKPDQQYKIPFRKGVVYKEIVIHLTDIDTAAEYEMFYFISKKVNVPPPVQTVEQIIDDSNTLIKYNPAWVPFTGSVYQDGTARYTVTIGATATLSFTGNRVEYWAEKRFNHGKAEVSIVRNDGAITTPITTPITTKEVDLYEKRMDNVKALLFDSGVLPQASYTVTIKMTGNKNEAWKTDYPAGTAAQNDLRAKASENNIILDYIKVYRAQ